MCMVVFTGNKTEPVTQDRASMEKWSAADASLRVTRHRLIKSE